MKDIQRTFKKFGKLRRTDTRQRLRITKLKKKLEELRLNLTLSELYELRESISDKLLVAKIEEEILEMATGEDDLWDIIRNEGESLREKAWKKLCRRIKNGDIKKKRGREILIKTIKEIPELRIEAWELLKTLDPSDGELEIIRGLDFIYSDPSLAKEVDRMLKKKRKRKNPVVEICEIIEEINQLKKGQE